MLPRMSTRAEVKMKFAGTAIDEKMMEVRDLAPSLCAFGSLLGNANEVVNGGRCKVDVLVKAEFAGGSFVIELVVRVGEFIQAAKNLLALGQNIDAKALLQLVGVLAQTPETPGLLQLLLFLAGNPAAKIDPPLSTIAAEADIMNLVFNVHAQGNHTPMEVAGAVVLMMNNTPLRRDVADVVKPLTQPGIDSITFPEAITIPKDQHPYFLPIGEGSVVVMPETEHMIPAIIYEVKGPAFDDKRWRISDGESSFSTDVGDQAFIDQVKAGAVVFGYGDKIKADMMLRQSTGADGKLKVQHEIVKVIEHIPAPHPSHQYRLLLTEGYDDDSSSED